MSSATTTLDNDRASDSVRSDDVCGDTEILPSSNRRRFYQQLRIWHSEPMLIVGFIIRCSVKLYAKRRIGRPVSWMVAATISFESFAFKMNANQNLQQSISAVNYRRVAAKDAIGWDRPIGQMMLSLTDSDVLWAGHLVAIIADCCMRKNRLK